MSYTPFLIAPFKSGLSRYYKPFLIGNDAFTTLENAYSWRGVLKKREGYEFLARIGQHVNNANTAFTIDAITQGANAAVTTSAAHNLVSGDIVTFQNATGMTEINGLTTAITVTGGTTFTCDDIDSTSFSAYTGNAATIHLPIQGLNTHLIPSGEEQELIGMTRYKAYKFNTTTSVFDLISTYSSGAAITWSGTNTDFFTSTNYAQSMWSTNGVDGLHFYQTVSATNGWNLQRPLVNATDRLEACKIVIPYKGRLLVLNTTEGATNVRHRQRARWCQIGTPYVPAAGGDPAVTQPAPYATDADAWRDDIVGKGGYIDADTSEEIVGAGIVNDTLIVGFERSFWRLRYTGNQILPFIWERINVEYGCDSQRSFIEFSNNIFSFSRYGWTAANTNQLARIDEIIPDLAYEIDAGLSGETRNLVVGHRDLTKQFFYWCYPQAPQSDLVQNDRTLSYNYLDQSFSIYTIGFRAFGEYKRFEDIRWQDLPQPWQNTHFQWNYHQAFDNTPHVVGGHLNGDIYIPFERLAQGTDNGTNFNFDIRTKHFNPYLQSAHEVRLQYIDVYCTGTTGGEFTLDVFINDDTSNAVVSRIVSTSSLSSTKYTRVFLGVVGRNFTFRCYLSEDQLEDALIGSAPVEIQGFVLHMREEGLIKERAT